MTYFYLNHALAGRADANRDSSIDSTLFEEPWIKHVMGYIHTKDLSLDNLPGFERIEENLWFILKPYESSENLNDLAERAALVLHKYIINDRVFLDSDLVKSCIEHISLYRFPDKQLQQLPDTHEKRQEIASKIFLAEDYPKFWREPLINGLTDEVLESFFDKIEEAFYLDLELIFRGSDKRYLNQYRNELIEVMKFFYLDYHTGEGFRSDTNYFKWTKPEVLGDTDDFKHEWLIHLCDGINDSSDFLNGAPLFFDGHAYSFSTIRDILNQEKRPDLLRKYQEFKWEKVVFDDVMDYSVKRLQIYALNERIRVDIDEVRKNVLKINRWPASDSTWG